MKKNKKKKLNKFKNRKKQLDKKRIEIEIEQDIQGHPDPERARRELRGDYKRLAEYAENIKRDPSDPKWEPCYGEDY